MKRYVFLAAFGFIFLAIAAVWMGGLNQDEGWYLYAANLVADGKMLYRDFFYTQAPLLPLAYSPFVWIWQKWGLLGARIFTLLLGSFSIVFFALLARRLAPEGKKCAAAIITFLLLGSNLYHLYYLTIPKTYALASLFVAGGFYLLTLNKSLHYLSAGICLALASCARISIGVTLIIVGLYLLYRAIRNGEWAKLIAFSIGGLFTLSVVYCPFLLDPESREGFIAAQSYHSARCGGGHDLTWIVGSISRRIRWSLPVFVFLGLAIFSSSLRPATLIFRGKVGLVLCAFLAIFIVQMFAPFPYEDYQVPIMGLLVVVATALLLRVSQMPNRVVLLALGITWAMSFGSPLLEKWSTNGQDRFWSLKKKSYELQQLRDVAKRIEKLDPGGKTIFTQDIYLAIETNRRVPQGFEMGPYAILSDADITNLIASTRCPVAALSGYCFAVDMPSGKERPISDQIKYWELLKKSYDLADREDSFGQNATPLLILKRR